MAQAFDALAAQRVDIARSLVSGVLEKKPRDPDALNLMADIARRSRRFEEAEELLARCLAAAPDRAGYRFNYAVILRRREKLDEALAQLDVLLAADPRNPLYREQKAAVLRQMGRLADALVLRRELAQEFPERPEVWLQFGHALRSVGAGADCVDAYRKAIELSPASSTAYMHLADLKTYHFTATETAAMEAQLLLQGLGADLRAALHFALGKAWGDNKEYAKSFDNFAKGNALRRAGVEFDPERLTAHRLNCEAVFTLDFFRGRTGWGCPSDAPIFLVGMPRSGSTLIEQILSSHSAIEGLGELADLDNVVSQKLSAEEGGRTAHEFWIGGWFEFRSGLIEAFPRAMHRLAAQDFRSMGEEYLKVAGDRCTQRRLFFTDKGLRNFGYVGLIHLVLPNARIIDVRRHPLDCGWSIFKSHFPGGQPFSERLGDIGRHYANYVRLMAHFDRVLPGRVHRVIYEDLIADPEREVRRLLEHVGLTFEERCLRFHENRRAVGTLSSEQVRAPLYRTGVAQWQPYEPWLDPLKSALGQVLERYPASPD
ncbi:MAG TPA: sulfotransferase [Rhizomicrobium sp.]|nr:sulfotransferase [Rhizomicrobium sp.]